MSIHRPTPATPQALLAYRPAYIHILYLYLQLRSRIIDCRQSLCPFAIGDPFVVDLHILHLSAHQ